jgi:hypothetical protein
VSSSLPPSTRDGVAYLLVAFFGVARNNEHKTRYCQQLTCRWLVACLFRKRMLLFLLNEKKEHPSMHAAHADVLRAVRYD